MFDSEEKDALGWLDFPEQFIVSKESRSAPSGWEKTSLLGWQLQHAPDVRRRYLVNTAGDPIGWLIGMPTHKGRLVEEIFFIESPHDLYELGGPWVAIHLVRGEAYVDSFGHLSIVYREDGQVITTNPEFIIEDEVHASLSSLMNIPEEDNWYPFGLTPRNGVFRLLPNHYLDIERGCTYRHWPDRKHLQDGLEPMSLDEASEIVSGVVKQNIEAIAQKYPLRIALTAGYDSRAILACARGFVDQLECVTHYLHPSTGKLDLETAKRLAKKHGLNLIILEERRSTALQKEMWLRRTGHSAAGANYHRVGTFSQDSDDFPTLTGHGPGVLKGPYHRSQSSSSERLTSLSIIERLGLPHDPEVIEAAERWVAGVPSGNEKIMLDLLYPEQRGACWAGVLRHGTPGALGFWPFAHRDVLEVAIRLPVGLMKSKAVHRRIIEREWPELLEVPVNDWWGWRKLAMKPRRLVSKSRILAGRVKRHLLKRS